MTASEAGDQSGVDTSGGKVSNLQVPDAQEEEAGSVENPIEVGGAADDNTDNARKSTVLQQDKRLPKLSRIKPKRVQSIKRQIRDRGRRRRVKGSESEVRPSQKLMPKGTKYKPTHRKGSDFKDDRPPLDLMPKGTKKNMPILRARTRNDGRQKS
jgi:hypothetical protein